MTLKSESLELKFSVYSQWDEQVVHGNLNVNSDFWNFWPDMDFMNYEAVTCRQIEIKPRLKFGLKTKVPKQH